VRQSSYLVEINSFMKALFLLIFGFVCLVPVHFWAQEVTMSDESVQFSTGNHEAVVVTIPFAKREVVEAQLKSELKSWKGKLSINGSEYQVIQGHSKALGEAKMDVYAKIIENGTEIKVAFAVDLGGKYVNKRDHPSHHKHVYDRAKSFGSKTASASIAKDMDADKKALKLMEKEEKKIEKEIDQSKKDIENYQKKIKESEKNIETKQTELTSKQEEIKAQNGQISERKKTAKRIK
jgi:hypothetical protein